MKTLKNTCLSWALSLLFALLVTGCTNAWAAETAVPEGYRLIPISSLEKLKDNNSKLVMKLQELELQVNLLRTPSNELSKQLTEVKQQLSKSQESLIISREQLKSAELLQKQMQGSLSLLEKQITIEREQEARTQKRLRRQRNIAYAFFGITIIGYIKKL